LVGSVVRKLDVYRSAMGPAMEPQDKPLAFSAGALSRNRQHDLFSKDVFFENRVRCVNSALFKIQTYYLKS